MANAVSFRRRRVDAERAAGDFVFAQSLPGTPDRQAAQAQRDPVRQQRQRKDNVIEKNDAVRRRELQPEGCGEAVVGGIEGYAEERRARDSGNAVWPAREVLPVQQDEADDLAETERDDGQIIAAQPQHWKTEHETGERREDAGERQADPERQTEILRDERVRVGADCIEGDIAKIEQTREADDNVEAEAEHRVGDDEDGKIEHIAVGVKYYGNDKRECEKADRGIARKLRRSRADRGRHAVRGGKIGILPNQSPDQIAHEHGANDGGEGAKARRQHERAGRSLFGTDADQKNKQPERHERRDRGFLHRSHGIGLFCAGLAFARHARLPLAHTFSISGRPKMPVGRKMSTMMRIENAATSLYSMEK